MKAHETILQPILEGTKQYVVPLFQRTYSWKLDNWKNLWDDLLSLYSAGTGRKHFIGAIVSMPVDMTPSGVNKFLLIDGQQRISTLFVILAAIRDAACENNPRLADQINELYLINKWAEGTNILKLYPSQADREQFFAIIQKKNDLDENNALIKAYRYFRHKIQSKDLSGQPIDMHRLHNILVQEIMVVDIVLDRDENPYLIFESLNAKGEPLTQADLVRNYLLMRITNADEQEMAFRDYWLPMQNTLGSELTSFIWRYLIKSANGVKAIRLDEIYDEVKQRLLGLNSTEVLRFMQDMHLFSGYYQCLINPDIETNRGISKRIKRINRWDIKTTYPFLLNLYHDYKQNKLSSVDFCEILEVIESFVVRRSFCRVPTNALNKIFLSLYKSLDTNQYVKSVVAELQKREWPGDIAFREAWFEFPIYLSGTTKCRHVLDSLEEAMTTNNEFIDLTRSQITIEHIMPQTLNEEWEQLLGERAAEIYDTYLHTIGNLTLTGKNSEMGNAPLQEKRRVFAQSNFAISRDVADSIIWNDTLIRVRATKLFQKAMKIWPHPGGNATPAESGNSSDGRIYSNSDPTGKKPTGYSLFGTEYQVDSWREMLLYVLSELVERHADEFIEKAVEVNTGRRTHIAVRSDNMIAPMKIPGSALWVEANQSSRSVLWLIDKVLSALGHCEDDFEAYW